MPITYILTGRRFGLIRINQNNQWEKLTAEKTSLLFRVYLNHYPLNLNKKTYWPKDQPPHQTSKQMCTSEHLREKRVKQISAYRPDWTFAQSRINKGTDDMKRHLSKFQSLATIDNESTKVSTFVWANKMTYDTDNWHIFQRQSAIGQAINN